MCEELINQINSALDTDEYEVVELDNAIECHFDTYQFALLNDILFYNGFYDETGEQFPLIINENVIRKDEDKFIIVFTKECVKMKYLETIEKLEENRNVEVTSVTTEENNGEWIMTIICYDYLDKGADFESDINAVVEELKKEYVVFHEFYEEHYVDWDDQYKCSIKIHYEDYE